MKTKKINEEQLRGIINKKVNESIATPIFYVRDEASDGVLEITTDLEEAISEANKYARDGGCYVVTDREDEVRYRTSNNSYKFEESKKIRFNESDITKIVVECVKKTLNEIGDTKWGSYRLGAVAARNSKKAIDAKTPQDSLKYHKTVRDALNTFDKASSNQNGERDSKLSKAFKKGLATGQKLEEDNEGMSPDVKSNNGLFSEPIENIRIGDEIIKIAQAASNISRVLAAYTDDDPSDYDFGYNYLEE